MSKWTPSQPQSNYNFNLPKSKLKKAFESTLGLPKVAGIKIRVGERPKPPAAATGTGHGLVLPRERAGERKTFGSHGNCFCSDRECEGVGSISHHVYINPYCNRGTVCETGPEQIHLPRSNAAPRSLKGSIHPNNRRMQSLWEAFFCMGNVRSFCAVITLLNDN